jgi:carbon-monoxide dehydrogenase medium subunit
MYPNSFAYHAADDVESALSLLTEHESEEVELMAGGHSLLPTMKSGLGDPDVVIDIGDLTELRGIDHGDETTRIGAMTTYAAIADDPMDGCTVLREAAAAIGDTQVRNMGTIGGNLAHSDPAADLPGASLAADATLHVTGPDGDRTAPASSFFEAMYTTAIDDDELLTAVEVPHLGANDASAYVKKPSPSSGYALVGVATALETDGHTITAARVAANGAFGYARRLGAVEEELTGASIETDGLAAEAASHATDDVDSYEILEDDTASSEFRSQLLEVYAERGVSTALDRV